MHQARNLDLFYFCVNYKIVNSRQIFYQKGRRNNMAIIKGATILVCNICQTKKIIIGDSQDVDKYIEKNAWTKKTAEMTPFNVEEHYCPKHRVGLCDQCCGDIVMHIHKRKTRERSKGTKNDFKTVLIQVWHYKCPLCGHGEERQFC